MRLRYCFANDAITFSCFFFYLLNALIRVKSLEIPFQFLSEHENILYEKKINILIFFVFVFVLVCEHILHHTHKRNSCFQLSFSISDGLLCFQSLFILFAVLLLQLLSLFLSQSVCLTVVVVVVAKYRFVFIMQLNWIHILFSSSFASLLLFDLKMKRCTAMMFRVDVVILISWVCCWVCITTI